ncbi:MAG: metal ABC transporter ATP-binding protein [Chitinophagales bacterium]|nr:metal ABC transporter ATP-binding protein [Chitinophagales bacterium]
MLRIENMSVIYPNGVRAISDVHLELEEGNIYGIIGPNGGGKSSFLKGILNLVHHTGNVYFNGQSIQNIAKQIAYIEQKENIDKTFPITVYQCVLMGTYPGLGLFKRPGEREKNAVEEALRQLKLYDYKNVQIGELSGGQFQRVLLARALVQESILLILDEPFVGIDINNETIIINQLKELARSGKTILIIHHDMETVEAYFDNLIMINKRVIASGKVSEVFNQENFEETFNNYTPTFNLQFKNTKI